MTYDLLVQTYLSWAKDLTVPPAEDLTAHCLFTREVSDLPDKQMLEAFYVVGAYTDALHLFVFAEQLTLSKDHNNNTCAIIAEDYTILPV